MEKLKIFWGNLGKNDRRKFIAELCVVCQVSPYTVSGWLNSGHEPRGLYKQTIVEFIRKNYDENFEL